MNDHQTIGNPDKKDSNLSGENKKDFLQAVKEDREEKYDQQKEDWQRGISAGEHEKMNATDENSANEKNSNRSGSSTIPLSKEDLTGKSQDL